MCPRMRLSREQGQHKRHDAERNRDKAESATARIATKCGGTKSDRQQRAGKLNKTCSVKKRSP